MYNVKTVSSVSGNHIVTCERMKWEHFFTSHTKISSNWIKHKNP